MMGFGFGGFGMIFMLVFWVGVVLVAVWGLGALFPSVRGASLRSADAQDAGPQQSAVDIVKQRYARGEISKAEYDEIRHGLGG